MTHDAAADRSQPPVPFADLAPARRRSILSRRRFLAGLALALGATADLSALSAAPAAARVGAAPAAQSGGAVLFHSTQFTPVAEREKMQNIILKDSPVPVEFAPQEPGPFVDILLAQAQAGRIEIGVVGGLHGDFPPFIQAGIMEDLSALLARLDADRNFVPTFVQLGKMGSESTQYYIPWIQATYLLAAHKRALEHLPAGANQDALTYEQLRQWAANLQQATGQRLLGFPAGPQGLIHRFFQGYLYPSYTGTPVTSYKSADAAAMWQEFKALWQHVNPASVNYDFMQEPLRAGEVWLAWDHTARLIQALSDSPDAYVVMPAPAGPKGRGFMPVIAGLGIPRGAPDRAAAEQVVDFMTRPATQVAILRELAFFPAVEATLPEDLPPGVRLLAEAVAKQATAADALPSLLPVGLGTKNGEWNKAYLDTFTRIVLRNEAVDQVLSEQATTMQSILDETRATCWPPDPPSDGPCHIA